MSGRGRGSSVVAMMGAIVVTAVLGGCGSGDPKADPSATIAPVQHEEPDDGWCTEYGGTLTQWSHAALEIEEPRFDEVLGVDIIGPADCYLELLSDTTTKSVVAVFIGDDPAVAEFLMATLPAQGWAGTIADPLKGGVFTHPVIGDLGYTFSASARSNSVPIDGPAIVITVLLAG